MVAQTRYRTFDVADDATPGRWIENQIGRSGAARFVPPVFERYARILHPAYYENEYGADIPVSWASIAEFGAIAAPGADETLTCLSDSLSEYEGDAPWTLLPSVGSLPTEESWRLIDILAPGLASPMACWFGVWEGYGFLRELRKSTNARLRLPGRDHILLHGPIYAAARSLSSGQRQSVNLWWAPDGQWCVNTDMEYDSTVVGGDADRVQRILDDPGLETVELFPR